VFSFLSWKIYGVEDLFPSPDNRNGSYVFNSYIRLIFFRFISFQLICFRLIYFRLTSVIFLDFSGLLNFLPESSFWFKLPFLNFSISQIVLLSYIKFWIEKSFKVFI
jgi:hypothetical protein